MPSGIGDFSGPEFEATPKDRLRRNADLLRFVSSLFADELLPPAYTERIVVRSSPEGRPTALPDRAPP